MPILLGHSMGGMTRGWVANNGVMSTRGVVLVDPTCLSPQRQRDVCGSDVAEQHRRLLGQDEGHVSAQLRLRYARRSPEIIELLARARLQTRISAFDVLVPPNPEYRPLVNAKIGRAHVCTPVTNAHLVCRLLLEKTNHQPHTTILYYRTISHSPLHYYV